MREGTSGLLIEKASSRLSQYMFKDDEQSAEKSKKIANRLGKLQNTQASYFHKRNREQMFKSKTA